MNIPSGTHEHIVTEKKSALLYNYNVLTAAISPKAPGREQITFLLAEETNQKQEFPN